VSVALEKSALFVPLIVMLLKVTVTLLLFVIVTVCGVDATPTGCVPKLRLVGTTASVGISVSFATNASEGSFRLPPVGSEDTTGISAENVCPVT
jgi:hypothetical protein